MTSKEINKPVSGFYYDNQLENKLLAVTLHANTEKSKDGPRYSQKWSKTLDADSANSVYPYGEEPIARSIISEDFQVSITNSVQNFGGDPIGALWNDAVKPFASYLNDPNLAKDLSTITSKLHNNVNSIAAKTEKGSTWGLLAGQASKITGFLENQFKEGDKTIDGDSLITKAAAVASRSLVVQGTQFAYYSGTGTDLGTLSMKFVVFSGYDKDGKYKSVQEQIEKLEWYVVGEFKPVDTKDTGIDIANGFAYWQLAPGGYIAGIKNINEAQYGTLKLRIGPFYAIENLIIQSAQFNYSKVMCKRPDQNITTLDPLYCEVILNLQPVTKFSGDRIFAFANGKRSENYRTTVLSEIQGSLDEVKRVCQNPDNINAI